MNIPISKTKSIKPCKEWKMDFPTFYDYFIYTKNWAYIMMIIVLPLYVFYWNVILFRGKKKKK